MSRQRHIAFYLPQFHPTTYNDEWWGPGFTEWSNVAAARPRFSGHMQPDLPADLGFYDLRLPETRLAQTELAAQYGIDGFCYYHYWFGGQRLLERPFTEVLESGEPDFPFCLAWANENWTRSWDGQSKSILIEQDYGRNERAHARWLSSAFLDERYIRVDGKPLFLIYRASDLPDPLRTTRVLREEARAAGAGDLFLCRVESFADERGDPTRLGFDAAVEFAPDWTLLRSGPIAKLRSAMTRVSGTDRRGTRTYDYAWLADRMMRKPSPPYLRFPCVTPGWDNTPRRRREPVVMRDATPAAYQEWVRSASIRAPSTSGGESLVFVNAWNEWGEGAHLEPGQRWGHQFLEAHRDGRASHPEAR